jgi:hypothetical protein
LSNIQGRQSTNNEQKQSQARTHLDFARKRIVAGTFSVTIAPYTKQPSVLLTWCISFFALKKKKKK